MALVVDDAVRRLQAAIGLLEASVGRRLDVEHRRGDLDTELQLMQDDRSRLAVELESTAARLSRVETAADHVGRRVHVAIGAIQEVLDRPDSPAPHEEE